MKKKATRATIYYHDGSYQVIEPDMEQFMGDWNLLVHAVSNGSYKNYVLS